MPRLLPVTERNDLATITFDDSLNLAGNYTVLGIARAGQSSTGVGAWFAGTYGAVRVNADGSYSYRLDNDDPDTNLLRAGQSADDRFTVTYSLGGVTQTDTITVRVTGADDVGQLTTNLAGTLNLSGSVTIAALQQYNITATGGIIWAVGINQTPTFTNYGVIHGEAPNQNTVSVLSAEVMDAPDTQGTVINYGLIEGHSGANGYGANGAGGVNNVTFVNYGVIRAVSEAVNNIPLSRAGGAGAKHFINYGTIEAISNVEAYASGTGGPGYVLENYGYIYARAAQKIQAHSITGVTIGQGAGSTLINGGTIHSVSTSANAESFGVAMFRDSTNHYAIAKIINTGTIVADVAVFGYGTSVGGITGMYVVNSGHVEGEYRQDLGLNTLDNQTGGTWIGAINCGYDEDFIRNAGLILGAVTLNDGSDFYDGRGGTVTGLVSGGAGLDVLLGGNGVDQLTGGEGADRLQGGGGADLLLGGAGADVFVYAAASDSTAAAIETLTDFQNGVDRIDLSLLAPSAVNLSVSGGMTTITATAADGTLTLRANGTLTMADIITAPKAAVTNGTEGTDLLFTGGAGAALNGLGGDDILDGGAGNDILDGGAGIDVMRGGKGDDIYYQDDFNDLALELEGEGTDELRTTTSARMQAFVENLTMLGTGDFFASGNRLDNIIIGNSGRNDIFADDGDDILIGGGGRDTLAGVGGRDIYKYLAVSDSVAGAADVLALNTGEDRIDLRAVAPISVSLKETMLGYWQNFAVSNVVTVQAAAGTMTINVNGKLFLSDFILGTEIVGTAASETVSGSANADTILGGAGDDQLLGLAGDDTLSGEAGNDLLDGGAGADIMTGGSGDDVYLVDNAADYVWEAGRSGTDTIITSVSYTLAPQSFVDVLRTADETATTPLNLTGNTQDNLIIGNAGDNILDGGVNWDTTAFAYAGTDTLRGLAGNDSYYVDTIGDTIIEEAGQGNDTVYARYSYALNAGASVETLATANAASAEMLDLTGNKFGQQIIGNAGNNVLRGLDGNDLLAGGAGNDRLYGGAGNDRLEGGAGADSFVFETTGDSSSYALRSDGHKIVPDQILDFASGADKIDLGAIDAIASTAANDAFTFIGSGPFTHQAGQLRSEISGGVTIIYADVDGNGLADLQISLMTPVTLTAADFIL